GAIRALHRLRPDLCSGSVVPQETHGSVPCRRAIFALVHAGHRPPSGPPVGLDLNDIGDEQVVDWYLERADFYDSTWMPRIRTFESWKHLDHLLATDDVREISATMADERPERLRRISSLWNELPWLNAVAQSR